MADKTPNIRERWAATASRLPSAPPRAVTWLIVTGEDQSVLGILRLHDILSARK